MVVAEDNGCGVVVERSLDDFARIDNNAVNGSRNSSSYRINR
jgi:hypothetical protein